MFITSATEILISYGMQRFHNIKAYKKAEYSPKSRTMKLKISILCKPCLLEFCNTLIMRPTFVSYSGCQLLFSLGKETL